MVAFNKDLFALNVGDATELPLYEVFFKTNSPNYYQTLPIEFWGGDIVKKETAVPCCERLIVLMGVMLNSEQNPIIKSNLNYLVNALKEHLKFYKEHRAVYTKLLEEFDPEQFQLQKDNLLRLKQLATAKSINKLRVSASSINSPSISPRLSSAVSPRASGSGQGSTSSPRDQVLRSSPRDPSSKSGSPRGEASVTSFLGAIGSTLRDTFFNRSRSFFNRSARVQQDAPPKSEGDLRKAAIVATRDRSTSTTSRDSITGTRDRSGSNTSKDGVIGSRERSGSRDYRPSTPSIAVVDTAD